MKAFRKCYHKFGAVAHPHFGKPLHKSVIVWKIAGAKRFWVRSMMKPSARPEGIRPAVATMAAAVQPILA